MNKKIKVVLATLAMFILIAAPTAALADKYGLSDTAGRAGLTRYGDSIPALAGSVVGTVLSLISVVFFILIVYGGFLWMTAHGKEEQVTKAKDTIIGAVIGLVVVLASFAITNFVFNSVNSQQPAAPTPEAPAAPAPPAVPAP